MILMRKLLRAFKAWTDARRPVPRLWLRSTEVRWGTSLGEWEHNNGPLRFVLALGGL